MLSAVVRYWTLKQRATASRAIAQEAHETRRPPVPDRPGAAPQSSQPVTADAIAAELETSKRSVYRDIAALMGQRVPIRGEAGIGYVLDGGFDMPPLMLTSDEIEAAVLGAQWVAGRGDPALARAARDLIAKIAATVPERLRPVMLEPAVASRRLEDARGRDARHGPGPGLDPRRAQAHARTIATSRSARPLRDRLAAADRLSRDDAPAGRPGAKAATTSAPSAPTGWSRRSSSTTAIRGRPAQLRARWQAKMEAERCGSSPTRAGDPRRAVAGTRADALEPV